MLSDTDLWQDIKEIQESLSKDPFFQIYGISKLRLIKIAVYSQQVQKFIKQLPSSLKTANP